MSCRLCKRYHIKLSMTETQEELAVRVKELQKEVERLNAQLKEKRFGLTWIDVPEAFEQESENKIPVLYLETSKQP